MENCASDIFHWFLENAFLLKPTKTEAVVSLVLVDVCVALTVLIVSMLLVKVCCSPDSVKLLGVTLHSTLSFDKQVSNVARSCYLHIRTLKQIRPHLSLDTAKYVALYCCLWTKLL